jgi:hypothetical protein
MTEMYLDTRALVCYNGTMSDDVWVPWHKRSAENAERHRKNQREARQQYVARNPEKVYASREESRKKYWDKHITYLRNWQKEWYEANKADPEFRAQRIARVRAREEGLNVPITRMFLRQTEDVYREARRLSTETGIPHAVDHYWPVNGENSCGLHVPWNLRVITGTENGAKRNKEPEDHWSSILKELEE